MRLTIVRPGTHSDLPPGARRTRGGTAVLSPVADPAPPAVPAPRPDGAVGRADCRRITSCPVDHAPVTAAEQAERSGHPAGMRRLTPLESGLAAVVRHDVHIERVWPMRRPPTGTLEDSSSASFQSDRRGTPPARLVPVGGLRMSQAFPHEPVMAAEVVDLLATVPDGLVVDATLGGAGHGRAILESRAGLRLLGLDRDPVAVEAARAELADFGDRAIVRQARFDALAEVVRDVAGAAAAPVGEPCLSGVLFDLGVSSPQLDVAERGFSYRRDGALDMRMDPTVGRTAADVVNESDEETLVELFVANGETRFARRIARAIVAARPLATTGQLADVVRAAIPAAARRTGGHPARRVFQAVRIAVNEELDQLHTGLDRALDLLVPGGRCIVISYHSGEDRLVKTVFTRAATDDCRCPPGLPCVCGAAPEYRLLSRGARRPTPGEIAANHRAEAARLRGVERLPPTGGASPTDAVEAPADGEVA